MHVKDNFCLWYHMGPTGNLIFGFNTPNSILNRNFPNLQPLASVVFFLDLLSSISPISPIIFILSFGFSFLSHSHGRSYQCSHHAPLPPLPLTFPLPSLSSHSSQFSSSHFSTETMSNFHFLHPQFRHRRRSRY